MERETENMSEEKLTKSKCKQCGHPQYLHKPYVDGTGWHCTADNCTSWNLCKPPKHLKKVVSKTSSNSVRQFFK